MHNFDHLVYRGTQFALTALNDLQSNVLEGLNLRGTTSGVKNLQAINVQKAIMAIGMFSLFESILQNGLKCQNGFKDAEKILSESDQTDLCERFRVFALAINTLKHGKGQSYERLIEKASSLPFRVKLPDENFFFEGNVSEISTLIEVDDTFVLNCAKLIEEVSIVIRKVRSNFYM